MSQQKGFFLDSDFEDIELTPEPVTCLGKTFESDDARREYFRNELRSKLPELRKIEGFPIGEDDDIINLSDPPYYTACPNPWLNDFIADWEKEKEQVKAEGKRTDNFEVKIPYAADVSEGKNNPIYMAHAYHTKVPHPAIMRYILHYTQPGDIVFDGFCGTGMTGVAANLCGSKADVDALGEKNVKIGVRHCICSDLSPIASLIASSYNLKFDAKEFERKANIILQKVEEELGWMYATKNNGTRGTINYTIWSDVFTCQSCGNELVLWNETVSEDTKSMKSQFVCPSCGSDCSKSNINKLKEATFDEITQDTSSIQKCVPVRINGITYSGKRFEKNIDSEDIAVYQKVMAMDLSSYRSAKILIGDESKRILSAGLSHVHHFYTKRNFILLNRIYELAKESSVLTAWFTSCLFNVSKMYKFRTDRKGSILYGTYYIPSLNIEYNPLRTLKGKLKDFIATCYSTRGNSTVSISSATKITQIVNDSIDYIFVDPPFGANLMYSELNSLWEGWIRIATNNKEEAIVSNTQQKNIFEYQNLMNQSLKEFYRILKPGKWMTVEFSNTSASVWNSIQNALQNVGFVIANVSALDKKQGSFKTVTTTTAVKQDLIITCFKPSTKLSEQFASTLETSTKLWAFVSELLEHLPVHLANNESTTAVVERSPKILYDRLIAYYVQHGYAVPIDATEFQKGLKERFLERDGMYFTASQALEYEEKRAKSDGFVPMALFISSEADGIEWLKRKLETPKTYQELQPDWMKDMVTPKKGDVLPGLDVILEENFIKDSEGKWSKPDPENASHLEQLRGKRLMKEFNLYLEAAKKPKAKRMKDTRLEVIRYGFKDCYKQKNYQDIVIVGDHIQESLLMEDEILLQYYDIAMSRI